VSPFLAPILGMACRRMCCHHVLQIPIHNVCLNLRNNLGTPKAQKLPKKSFCGSCSSKCLGPAVFWVWYEPPLSENSRPSSGTKYDFHLHCLYKQKSLILLQFWLYFSWISKSVILRTRKVLKRDFSAIENEI